MCRGAGGRLDGVERLGCRRDMRADRGQGDKERRAGWVIAMFVYAERIMRRSVHRERRFFQAWRVGVYGRFEVGGCGSMGRGW